MVGLPDGEIFFKDMCNRLDRIPACDRRTDEQTDILPRYSQDSLRYAYTSRGKSEAYRAVSLRQLSVLLAHELSRSCSPGYFFVKTQKLNISPIIFSAEHFSANKLSRGTY